MRVCLKEVLTIINGSKGNPHSFDALEKILDDQAYRLSFWRVASDEINYRRFFDINDLAERVYRLMQADARLGRARTEAAPEARVRREE